MKTRVDFVSNSSSCSFVVTSSPKDAVKVFNKEFGKTVAWPYDVEGIDVTLTGTKAALDKVKSAVECGTVSKAYDGVDEYELYGLTVCTALSIPLRLWKGINQMFVSTEDINEGNVMLVRLLKAFFEKRGIEVADCGDCDSSLDGDDFMLELMRKVMLDADLQEKTR